MTKEELMKEFNLGIYSIQRWIRLAGSNDPEDIRKCMAERKASAKQKMSQVAKKRSLTEEGRAHLLKIASHHHTDESKAKLSKSLKGRKKSDETKARMSKAFKGRKYSDSMKSKLSESQKQRFKKINEEIKSFDDMITSAEAAEILHCGKTTFELVFRGKAIVYRGKNLYPKSFLQEFNAIMKEHRGRSHYENEIFNFINMPDAQLNNRTAIAPQELDIYIPSKNLAIEFDGLYWHSTANGKDKNAHLNKTIECNYKGIRLIHIFEDEWTHKQELVKSIINSALGRTDKVYARNCVFKQVEKKDAETFFNANHLNGNVRFDKAFGLYFKDELVQCCSFGKSRFKKGEIELLRMANKLGISVIGGFLK